MLQLEIIKEAVSIIEKYPKDKAVLREQLYLIEKAINEIRNDVR